MREAVMLVALLPIMVAISIALWILAPERRLVLSAVLAGIAVGRVAAGAAW